MRLMGPDHIGHRRRRHPAGRHEENVRDLQVLYVDKKAHCCAMTVLFLATAFVIGLCTGRSSLGHVLADGAELFHRSNYHLCLLAIVLLVNLKCGELENVTADFQLERVMNDAPVHYDPSKEGLMPLSKNCTNYKKLVAKYRV